MNLGLFPVLDVPQPECPHDEEPDSHDQGHCRDPDGHLDLRPCLKNRDQAAERSSTVSQMSKDKTYSSIWVTELQCE